MYETRKRLELLQRETGWSYDRIAVAAGLPEGTVKSVYTQGKGNLMLTTAAALAKAFAVPLAYFATDDWREYMARRVQEATSAELRPLRSIEERVRWALADLRRRWPPEFFTYEAIAHRIGAGSAGSWQEAIEGTDTLSGPQLLSIAQDLGLPLWFLVDPFEDLPLDKRLGYSRAIWFCEKFDLTPDDLALAAMKLYQEKTSSGVAQ